MLRIALGLLIVGLLGCGATLSSDLDRDAAEATRHYRVKALDDGDFYLDAVREACVRARGSDRARCDQVLVRLGQARQVAVDRYIADLLRAIDGTAWSALGEFQRSPADDQGSDGVPTYGSRAWKRRAAINACLAALPRPDADPDMRRSCDALVDEERSRIAGDLEAQPDQRPDRCAEAFRYWESFAGVATTAQQRRLGQLCGEAEPRVNACRHEVERLLDANDPNGAAVTIRVGPCPIEAATRVIDHLAEAGTTPDRACAANDELFGMLRDVPLSPMAQVHETFLMRAYQRACDDATVARHREHEAELRAAEERAPAFWSGTSAPASATGGLSPCPRIYIGGQVLYTYTTGCNLH